MKLLALLLLYEAAASAAVQKPFFFGERTLFNHDFDQLVHRLLDQWHTPGLAVAVVDGNETYSKVRRVSTGLSAVSQFLRS